MLRAPSEFRHDIAPLVAEFCDSTVTAREHSFNHWLLHPSDVGLVKLCEKRTVAHLGHH